MSNKGKREKYRAIITTQAKEIELLQQKLLYADTFEHSKDFIVDLIKEIEILRQEKEEEDKKVWGIWHFGRFVEGEKISDLINDEYFNGLTLEQILELAKKSIRLTSDNCAMQHKLEDIAEVLDNSELGEYIKKIIDREN